MFYHFYKQEYSDGRIFYHLQLDKLSDEEYDKVKPFVEHLGGHWRERYNCFVFPEDVRDLFEKYPSKSFSASAEYLWREKTQFFPTPKLVAERVVELAEIETHHIVLEPSAGQGALLDCIKVDCPIMCVEPLLENVEILRNKGYVCYRGEFENYYSPDIQYDRIIMNPPYANQNDIKHVKMAYDMLAKGGILVAVISENALYYQTDLSIEFNEFLTKENVFVEAVSPRAFEESGTTIETVIIKIVKT